MNQRFVIPMAPVAKARPRVVRLKNGASQTWTPDKTVEAEERVRWHLREQGACPCLPGAAVRVSIDFYVPRPKTKMNCVKHPHPICKPDKDNLEKLVVDACIGILWQDDAQICSSVVNKIYTTGEPCIILEVEEMP